MIRRGAVMRWRMSVATRSSVSARDTSRDLTRVVLHWGCTERGTLGVTEGRAMLALALFTAALTYGLISVLAESR